MQAHGLPRLLVASGIVILTACATTQPNSVKVGLIETQVVLKDEMLIPVFNIQSKTAAIDVADGARVTGLKQLTSNTDRFGQVSKPAVSPDQDAIAFVEFSDGKSGIFSQSLGSSAKSSIVTEEGVNLSPAYTPDGRYLIFSSDRSGESQSLWRKRADGAGGITQITSSNSFDWQPTIAADGETIIFQSHRKNNLKASIWSINMNGGLLTQLSEGHSPKVSPDGRRIVFVKPSSKSNLEQIWSMQIDGSGMTHLSTGSFDDVDPSWHPNGRYIVFATNESTAESKANDFNIWFMRSDGSERTQLTENFSHDDAPVFDRRGQDIVFRSNRGGQWNYFVFKPRLN